MASAICRMKSSGVGESVEHERPSPAVVVEKPASQGQDWGGKKRVNGPGGWMASNILQYYTFTFIRIETWSIDTELK
jgi:hypothetical protein